MEDEKLIKVMKNGPYMVFAKVPLDEEIIGIGPEGEPDKWIQGEKYPEKDGYVLCRCGKSKTMPFCDASHKEGFDGTETADLKVDPSKIGVIEGPDLTLVDNTALCAGARFCHRSGGTWDHAKNSGNPTFKRMAIEEACNCPSGRLVACEKDGREIEPSFEKSISIIKDPQKRRLGPLWVKGGIPVESADGNRYEIRNRMTLCTCERSKNKPFCDGSHLE